MIGKNQWFWKHQFVKSRVVFGAQIECSEGMETCILVGYPSKGNNYIGHKGVATSLDCVIKENFESFGWCKLRNQPCSPEIYRERWVVEDKSLRVEVPGEQDVFALDTESVMVCQEGGIIWVLDDGQGENAVADAILMKCITDYLLKPENRIQLYVNFFHDPFYGDQEKSLWIVRSDGWNIHDPMLQHYLSTYGKKALRGHYQEISMERYQEEAQHNLARGRDWTGEKLGPLAQLLCAVNKGGLGVQRIMNESGATSAVHTIMGAASYYKGAWEQHNLKQPVGKQPEVNEIKSPESVEKKRIIGDPNAEDKLENLDFFEQQHPEFWDDKMEKEYNDLQRQQSNFDRSQSMNVQTGERFSEVKADVDVSPGRSEDPRDIIKLDEIEVKFNQNPKHDSVEFARQLKAQEDGMNQLTVDEYLTNRDRYLAEGRALEGNAVQQAVREQALTDKIEELIDSGKTIEDAVKQANDWMDTQAALHNPDQIAGGNPLNISGMGDKGINSSLGSQWKYRIDDVDERIRKAAEGMTEAERQSTHLNIKLTQ
ncbi:hypothetical protein FACS189418_0900 [Clostridia bacterium]|nr:hypothetical protein FACS189418_0900 [Clostridia bacterium]